MKLELLKTLNTERAARRAVIVVTDVASGKERLVKAADIARDFLSAVLADHLRTGKSGMEETAEGRVFLTGGPALVACRCTPPPPHPRRTPPCP